LGSQYGGHPQSAPPPSIMNQNVRWTDKAEGRLYRRDRGIRPNQESVTALLRTILKRSTAGWLVGVFLLFGPVYWLPGIPMAGMRRAEWLLFLVAVALVGGITLWERKRPFPTGMLGPWGFAGLLLLWVPGLVQSVNSFEIYTFVSQLIFSSTFFWCFFCLARDGPDVYQIFRRAFVLLAGLSIISLGTVLLSTRDWSAPCTWNPVTLTGFGLRTTGWSVGLALFIPIAAAMFLPAERRGAWGWKLAGVVGLLVLLGNQFFSGGRTGLLVSFLVVATFLWLRLSRGLAVAVVLTVLVASPIYYDDSCIQHLELQFILPTTSDSVPPLFLRHMEDADIITKLNVLATRRLQGYWMGLSKIPERPFLGHGLQQFLLDTPYGFQIEIHNLWIKWGVYTGILAPLWFLGMVALILRAGWRLFRHPERTETERTRAAALGLVVIAGLVISLLEPNIPIGAFQISALWWAAAGALIGQEEAVRTRGVGAAGDHGPK